MSGKQLVTIVLPVYNGERFLRQSIESCLGQTYRDIELIVVDDGSTDNSTHIVKSFDDKRIKLICHETNKRTPGALNTGFSRSSGAYLTWTSHDNYYAPTAIAEMVSSLELHPKIDFLFANQYDIDEAGQIIGERRPGPFEKLVEWCCASGAFLYRRSVYEKIGGYDERAFPVEDYDYFLRAYAQVGFGSLDSFLYYGRIHPQQVTKRFGTAIIESGLAARRRSVGIRFWRERHALYNAHIGAVSRLLENNKRRPAAHAALWAVLYNPACIVKYDFLAYVTAICLGHGGFRLLQRIKHAIRPPVTRHS
jgi:glycosyltransferase involved in cell wall biosynthesis